MSLPTNLAAPNTFVANTDALAAEVNENFSYVVDEINDTNAEVNLKAAKGGDTYTGTHNMTGATVTVATAVQTTATAQVASTAFVIGQAGTNSPIMDSVAAAGTSSYYARQDHVHPSDTAKLDATAAASTYAPLISPALSGNPTAPTPTAGDNDTSIATTAFVTGAIASLIDSAPGTLDTLNELAAALGDDPNFAATMTTQLALKAPLASPTFSGTPTVPTASADTTSIQAASTAFVIGQAGSTAPVQDDTTAAVGTSLRYARADHRHPINPVIASSVETCTTKALEAAASASTATTQAGLATAAYDSFDDRYLGAKASDPSVDNDGNALLTGALYFNTGANEMRVYSGSAWVAAYIPSSSYATLTGEQTLTNKTIAYALNTLTGVQPTLVSGTNIKTINSTSLLGSGNVSVQPTLVSGTSIKTINSTSLLGSGDVSVQPTLVSGTNIKTINSISLLGGGDISVGGGLVLLSTVTASSSATVDIETTFDSTYDNYIIIAHNVAPSTDAQQLSCRLKVSGTYASSAYKYCNLYATTNAATPSNQYSDSATEIKIGDQAGGQSNSAAYGGLCMTMTVYNASNNTLYNKIVFDGTSVAGSANSYRLSRFMGSAHANTYPLTGVRFYYASGNVATGVFRLYGIKKS